MGTGTEVKTSVSVAQQPISSLYGGPFQVGGGDNKAWVKWVIGAAVLIVLIVMFRGKRLKFK